MHNEFSWTGSGGPISEAVEARERLGHRTCMELARLCVEAASYIIHGRSGGAHSRTLYIRTDSKAPFKLITELVGAHKFVRVLKSLKLTTRSNVYVSLRRKGWSFADLGRWHCHEQYYMLVSVTRMSHFQYSYSKSYETRKYFNCITKKHI